MYTLHQLNHAQRWCEVDSGTMGQMLSVIAQYPPRSETFEIRQDYCIIKLLHVKS